MKALIPFLVHTKEFTKVTLAESIIDVISKAYKDLITVQPISDLDLVDLGEDPQICYLYNLLYFKVSDDSSESVERQILINDPSKLTSSGVQEYLHLKGKGNSVDTFELFSINLTDTYSVLKL